MGNDSPNISSDDSYQISPASSMMNLKKEHKMFNEISTWQWTLLTNDLWQKLKPTSTQHISLHYFLVYFSKVFVLYLLQLMFIFLTDLSHSIHSIYPLQVLSCLTLSCPYLPFNFHYTLSYLSHVYIIITHAPLPITVHNSSQCLCSSCLLLSHVQTSNFHSI